MAYVVLGVLAGFGACAVVAGAAADRWRQSRPKNPRILERNSST
jgi:hypothetical protein